MSDKLRFGRYSFEVSNLDKTLFPGDGITKGDLIEYYQEAADAILPHLKGRPLALERYPDGIKKEGFFQKDTPDYFPDWIKTVKLSKENGKVDYVLCENTATLAYLANQACITLHGWLSRERKYHYPDRLIFDLDPPGDDFDKVRQAALRLRELLDELGLESFVMTTGSRGLHVAVSLNREKKFDEVRSFAKAVAERLAEEEPERLTVEPRKNKRKGRVFLDYMRNSYGQHAVVPYTVRAKPGAPVAAPLEWEEMESGRIDARSYNLKNVLRRLGQKGDPWSKIRSRAQGIASAEKALKKDEDS